MYPNQSNQQKLDDPRTLKSIYEDQNRQGKNSGVVQVDLVYGLAYSGADDVAIEKYNREMYEDWKYVIAINMKEVKNFNESIAELLGVDKGEVMSTLNKHSTCVLLLNMTFSRLRLLNPLFSAKNRTKIIIHSNEDLRISNSHTTFVRPLNYNNFKIKMLEKYGEKDNSEFLKTEMQEIWRISRGLQILGNLIVEELIEGRYENKDRVAEEAERCIQQIITKYQNIKSDPGSWIDYIGYKMVSGKP